MIRREIESAAEPVGSMAGQSTLTVFCPDASHLKGVAVASNQSARRAKSANIRHGDGLARRPWPGNFWVATHFILTVRCASVVGS